jgi:amidase
MFRKFTLAAALAATAGLAHAQPINFDASAQEQQAEMTRGALTSEALVRAYLDRIADLDHRGPRLNSVLVISPKAISDAQAMDRERAAGRTRGPLHGVPVLIKDNIESADGTATTAGSLALADNVTGRDAPLVKRLRDAGAVIIGKTNLSEWANYRSTHSISGWSAVGGLVRNPYARDRSACGSSSGTGAAIAAGFATLGVGTETDGSVTCPAAFNGLVGLKPTLGLVPRTNVVPLSPEQDTAGPMTRTVYDAAAMLTAMAGSDPADPATRAADGHKTDFTAGLKPEALKGVRIGVVREEDGAPDVAKVYEQALAALKAAGAVLVDVKAPTEAQMKQIGDAENATLQAEFKAAINDYLAHAPAAVKSRSLDDLIAFNKATPAETPLFGQEIFEQSAKAPPLTDAGYKAKRALAKRLAGPEGVDRMLKEGRVEAIVMSGGPPAAVVDLVNGDNFGGPSATLAAVSGYPHLIVPMGLVRGMPVGLSILGPAGSDAKVLAFGYAFEQQANARRRPEFLPTVAALPEVGDAVDLR